MKRASRYAAALALATALAACATSGNGAMKTLSQQDTVRIITIGKSTRADVKLAFGDASVTHFDNGYELWLYQVGVAKIVDSLPLLNLLASSADNERELSILFNKSGIVKKYQLRER
ncbi:MAG TPA: hypothetical protein DCW29_09910 [Janthinobacterium sp.]|nr:hypothetical protein [Janthinobacterium sp.]